MSNNIDIFLKTIMLGGSSMKKALHYSFQGLDIHAEKNYSNILEINLKRKDGPLFLWITLPYPSNL